MLDDIPSPPAPAVPDEAVIKPDPFDFKSISPNSLNEPSITCKLSGNSVSDFAEMCGWTGTVPLKFSNIRSNTKFKEMADKKDDMVAAAVEARSKSITLAEMKKLVGRGQVNSPVYVKVVAKKKIDTIVNNNRLLIIPLVVVADDSGYCVVCSFNEGALTIHNQVDIGDVLIITSCQPQNTKRPYHKGLFSDDMYLDLELKLQWYSVRNHYLRKFNALKLSEYVFPPRLFDTAYQLKLPSELEQEFTKSVTPPWVEPVGSEGYYDLIGVISYVSRIERYKTSMQNFDKVESNDQGVIPFTRYTTFRCIYVVDKASKPILVKITNLNFDEQELLVPGAMIVLTHCQTTPGKTFSAHSITSHFSQIYVGTNFEKYSMIHQRHGEKAKEIIMRDNYIQILSRKDIKWSIGGMLPYKIKSNDEFVSYYTERGRGIELPDNLPRRESRRLCVKGTVVRIFKIVDEERLKVDYVSNRYKQILKTKSQYKMIANRLPSPMYKNATWYSFIRKLPPCDSKDLLKHPKSRDIMKGVVNGWKDYCGPLLMPAVLNKNTMPTMANLDRVDGPPYYLLDVVDEENLCWFQCIWKSGEYSMEEKTEKLDLVKGKMILALMEVFCIEVTTDMEVNLHDFVAYEDHYNI